jgi:hypothetical protein
MGFSEPQCKEKWSTKFPIQIHSGGVII